MNTHSHIEPLIARTPGGVGLPEAADEAFAPLPSATAVTVGVVDTGLVVDGARRPHPWFADHVSFREQDIDLLPDPGAPQVRLGTGDGHGTFVTGRILLEAPRARVSMWGVLDKSRAGAALDADDDALVADAVRQLGLEPHVQVINLSFGGGRFTEEHVPANLGRALDELDPRIAVVAAAGNDGQDSPVWPAAFDRVISVGALDDRQLVAVDAPPPRAPFSNHGPWVKVYAGGVDLLATFVHFVETVSDVAEWQPQNFRGWATWSGTSFAAATVSGRIAQTAIELDLTGAQAADIVLREAPTITEDGAVWVRGTGSRTTVPAS